MAKIINEQHLFTGRKEQAVIGRTNEVIVIMDIEAFEGYGVYVSFPYSDEDSYTTSFGTGHLAEIMATKFFEAVVNYFESVLAGFPPDFNLLEEEWQTPEFKDDWLKIVTKDIVDENNYVVSALNEDVSYIHQLDKVLGFIQRWGTFPLQEETAAALNTVQYPMAEDFIKELNNYYKDRLNEGADPSLFETFPTYVEALKFYSLMSDRQRENVKYPIQSPLMDATDNLIVAHLVSTFGFDHEKDYHDNNATVTIEWDRSKFDGETHVNMDMQTVIDFETSLSVTMLEMPHLLQKELKRILQVAEEEYKKQLATKE